MIAKRGSFRIQKMSNPYGEWLWSMWNEQDSPTGLSKGGYKSAEAVWCGAKTFEQ